jgi:hypothetical protein
MNATSDREPRRSMLGWAVDAGMLGSLLAGLIVVWLFDRSAPPLVPPDNLDLVFVLDQGQSMRGFIDALKASCLERANAFKSGGIDCRFAVVPFGCGRKRISAVPLTDDLTAFEQQLDEAPAAGEPTAETTVVAALERALALEFRKDTPVLFFVISRAPCKDDREVAAIGSRMAERGITTIVQADASERDHCQSLYKNGGRFFSMEGTDLTDPAITSSHPSTKDDQKKSPPAANLISIVASDARSFDSSKVLKPTDIYASRTAPNREELVIRMGGSRESESAVRDGLAWLARHQADEGYWSDQQKCEKDHMCSNLNFGGNAAPIAETGLAILAFQAGGNYSFNCEKYSAQVTRGLDWLVKQQKTDGSLFGPYPYTWYQHGIATFALAEACAVALANDEEPEPRYLNAARRAVKFIESHQYARGGWQYLLDNDGNGDTSVTGWQVLALKSAQEAKIDVSPGTIQRVQQFYESCGNPATGLTGYMDNSPHTDLTTAVGLVVQIFFLHKPDSPLARKAALHLKDQASTLGVGGDFYTLYNGTLGMFLSRGDAWKQWNLGVRDAVVGRQEKSGCARGSWSDGYGRTLGTSWAVLTLEVYYRYATEDAAGGEKDNATRN